MKKLLAASLLLLISASISSAQIRDRHVYIDDGNGNFIDLIASSLTTGYQVTIPDPGANASVILSKSGSGQTITGGLTVNGGFTAGAFSLPTTAGTSTYVLTSGGDGTSSWQPAGGSSSGLSSFGYTYQLATLADATVPGGADVPLSNNGPLTGITHTAGTTTITVPNAGVYEITYSVSYTSGIGAQMAIAVNGTVDASTPVTFLNSADRITGVAMMNLAAGDVLTLRNNSATTLTMELAPGTGAQLSIKQLN